MMRRRKKENKALHHNVRWICQSPVHVPFLLRMSRAHAQRLTPTFSNRKQVQPLVKQWLPFSYIDDLCLDELARGERAVLTVTPTPALPPLPSRFFSLYRLCLLKAKITPEIGWGRVNVGQELLVQTWAAKNNLNVPKNRCVLTESTKKPPVAGKHKGD